MGAPKALNPTRIQRIDSEIRVEFDNGESLDIDDVAGTTLKRLCSLAKIPTRRDWNDVQRRIAVDNWLDELFGAEQEGLADFGGGSDENPHHGDEERGGSDGEDKSDSQDNGVMPEASESDGEAADGDGQGDGQQPNISFMVSFDGEPNWLPAEVVAQMFGSGGGGGSGEPPSWDGSSIPEWAPTPDERPDSERETDDESPVHHKMAEVLSLLASGRHVYLWGEKGSGKSTAGIKYAEMMATNLYAISGHPHLMRGEFIGALLPSGPHDGPLVSAARDGVLLFDEIDNTSPSSVTQMNLVIANGFISTAAGDVIQSHPGFRVIATANTNGQGATTEFVGRSRLDAATLDRFVSVEWGTDYALERYIVRRTLGLELSVANEWLSLCHAMRKNISDNGLKCGVSMRNVIDGAKTMSIQATDDWDKTNLPRLSMMDLARGLVLNKLPEDQQVKVLTGV